MSKDTKQSLPNKIAFALLMVLIVLTTLAYGTVHQPAVAIFYLLLAVAALCWALSGLLGGGLAVSRTMLQIPMAGAVLYALVQLIPFGYVADIAGVSGVGRTISIEPFWTQLFAVHMFALLMFFVLLLSLLDSAKRVRKVVTLLTVFGFALGFFGILQAVLSPTKIYGLYEALKPFGPFVNRHNFAAMMEMTIAIPVGLLFAGAIPRDKRLIYLTAVGLMGVALVLSGSRGGLVSLISALLLIAFLAARARESGSVLLRFGLVAALVVAIIGGAVLTGGESSLTRFSETAQSADVTTNRGEIWKVSMRIIGTHMPLGAGFGAFAAAYTPFDPANGSERVEQAHNDYLQIAADAGVIGIILGVFFIWQLFRSGIANVGTENIFRRGVAIGALGGCFAILVHSLFDFVLHTTAISVCFLTLVALVVASGRHFRDDEHLYERRRKRAPNVTSIDEKRKTETT